MRFSVAVTLLASAGYAAAQTTSASSATSTGGSCSAQNIVDACVDGYQSQIQACKSNDWVCLCNVYTNVLTCYNNCPDSNERPPVQNEVTQYCNAAAPILSASSASAATAGSTSAAAATSAPASTTASGTKAATGFAGSSATASANSKGAGVPVAVPAGGVLAFFLGVAGLL